MTAAGLVVNLRIRPQDRRDGAVRIARDVIELPDLGRRVTAIRLNADGAVGNASEEEVALSTCAKAGDTSDATIARAPSHVMAFILPPIEMVLICTGEA